MARNCDLEAAVGWVDTLPRPRFGKDMFLCFSMKRWRKVLVIFFPNAYEVKIWIES